MFKKVLIISGIVLVTLSSNVYSADTRELKVIGKAKEFAVNNEVGKFTIKRVKAPCGLVYGKIQALIPVNGVHLSIETDILNALNDKESIVVDMREVLQFSDATIPGAINIPYTDIVANLDKLGCKKSYKWVCDKAKKVYAFCNGPACAQSPIAIKAMVREGFPLDKIYYYRGGMMVWQALGLSTIEGDF